MLPELTPLEARLTCSRFGQYVVPAGLFILVFAVLSSKSSKRELAPWLPLFFTTLAVLMAALPGVLILFQRPQVEWPRSLESSSSLEFSNMGAGFHYSPTHSSAESGLALSSILPRPRDGWPPPIWGLWQGITALPSHQGHGDTDMASYRGSSLLDPSRISQDDSARSDAPLINGTGT